MSGFYEGKANSYSSWYNGVRYSIFQTSPLTVSIGGQPFENKFLLFSDAYDFCIKKIDELTKVIR